MKKLYTFALILLLSPLAAHGMRGYQPGQDVRNPKGSGYSGSTSSSSRFNALPDADDANDASEGQPGYSFLRPPDLKPIAATALAHVLKNPSYYGYQLNIEQPNIVIVHGDAGNGKTTVINAIMEFIAADPVRTRASILRSDDPDEDRESLAELLNEARQKAKEAACPHAVLIIDNFEYVYGDAVIAGALKDQCLYQPNDSHPHLLIIGEARKAPHTGEKYLSFNQDIEIRYPGLTHRNKLVSYYTNFMNIHLNTPTFNAVCSCTEGFSVQEIRTAVERIVVMRSKDPVKMRSNALDIINEMKHPRHAQQAWLNWLRLQQRMLSPREFNSKFGARADGQSALSSLGQDSNRDNDDDDNG